MNLRRLFLKRIVAGTALASMAFVPLRTLAKHNKFTGQLVHHVFFWLKEPNNPLVRKQFEKGVEELLKVETIRQSHVAPTDL